MRVPCEKLHVLNLYMMHSIYGNTCQPTCLTASEVTMFEQYGESSVTVTLQWRCEESGVSYDVNSDPPLQSSPAMITSSSVSI